MVDIRLSLIKSIDKRAIMHLTNLIIQYLLQHNNVGCVTITQDSIVFSKFVFFKLGEIKYNGNNLAYRDGTVYFTGNFPVTLRFNDEKAILLLNILHQLKPGYVCKLPL